MVKRDQIQRKERHDKIASFVDEGASDQEPERAREALVLQKSGKPLCGHVQNRILSEMCSAAIALEASLVVIPRLLKLLIVWQKTIDVLRFCQQ
jgi:hypothetical protein